MPDDRSARLLPSPLLVPATFAAVVAVLAAVGATGSGLLGPGVPLSDSSSLARRAAGAALLIAGAGALWKLRASLSSLAAAAAITAAVATLTLPVSDVSLDLADLFDRDRSGSRAEAKSDGDAGDATVVPLPPGATVEGRGGVLVIVLPDGSEQVLDGPANAFGEMQFETTDGQRFEVPDQGAGSLAEGQVVLVPADDNNRGTISPGPPDASDIDVWLISLALAIVTAGVFWLALFPPKGWWRERRTPQPVHGEPRRDDESTLDPAAAEAGLSASLAAMLRDPDPRTAIVGAYAALLEGLAAAGAPRRPEEAPHEHLDRVLAPLGVSRDPVHLLAGLFVLARFSPHEPTTAHRGHAIGALQGALAGLQR